MKKYILPIILIVLLTLTCFANASDLFGTYDKRIKLTIDHTKIDADLSWFPVTVFLTSSQMEEVFTEFDADEDFDRIAFTTSDGETQLYADCELFDYSEQKAIYHVSKTGWTVSSSADTDIYLYYSNIADHNTTYISKSGGTAAQSVWDSSFKAVYHMNDHDVTPTETFTDDFEGGDLTNWSSPGDWSVDTTTVHAGTYSAKCDGGETNRVLAEDTGSSYNYYKMDFYFRANTLYTYYMPNNSFIAYNIGYFGYYDGSVRRLPVDTSWVANTWYHIELYFDAVNDFIMVWIDGNYKGQYSYDVSAMSGPTFNPASSSGKTMFIDDVKFYTYDSPAYSRVSDSTSNANHGTKKGANEPAEATGQVGQGQDFDGSDDYISLNYDYANSHTIDIVFKGDNDSATNNRVMVLKGLFTEDWNLGSFAINGEQIRIREQPTPAASFYSSVNSISDDTWYCVSYSYNGSSNEGNIYIDGVFDNSISEFDSIINLRGIGGQANSNEDYYKGIIDEVRISSTARSAAWIAATYDSLWDNLLTYGSEETAPIADTNVLFIFSNF